MQMSNEVKHSVKDVLFATCAGESCVSGPRLGKYNVLAVV